MSPPGVNVNLWGPPMWRMLHSLSFLPPSVLQHSATVLIEFIHLLQYLLPCIHCRRSYVTFLRDMPLTVDVLTNAQFSEWMYELHNKVNRKLNKPVPTYEVVHKRYFIRPMNVSVEDVVDIIAYLGLNTSEATQPMFSRLWTLLPTVLDALSMHRVGDLVRRARLPDNSDAIVSTAIWIEASYYENMSLLSSSDRMKTYHVATSSQCSSSKSGCA